MRHRWRPLLRDAFLIVLALVILYDQVFIARSAQAILIFLVIFLFGSVPALRGDAKPGEYGTFARFVMFMLGVELPEEHEHRDYDGPLDTDGPTSSDLPPSAEREPDSPDSPKQR